MVRVGMIAMLGGAALASAQEDESILLQMGSSANQSWGWISDAIDFFTPPAPPPKFSGNLDSCDETVYLGPRESGYRGCQDHTVSNRRCQQWEAQWPNLHLHITVDTHKNSGLEQVAYGGVIQDRSHNFCRNPDGAANIWCYTDSHDERWNFCKPRSEVCDETYKVHGGWAKGKTDGSGYRGCQSITHTGKKCQQWASQYPHEHERTPIEYPDFGLGYHNYCRNPDGEPRIWCYTEDPETRWDFCDHCADGYSGDDCSIPPACSSAYHCNGHATLDMDSTNGCVCNCASGWSGNDCTIPPPCKADRDCSGHGTTTDADMTNGCTCACTDGFSGGDCSTPPACQNQACSGHGITSDKDATDGCMCTCADDFLGDDCSIPPACSSSEHCNGHATLDMDRTDGCLCHCANGWSGDDCTIPPTCDAKADCSGHGTTSDMDKTDGCKCYCTGGFSGDDCSVAKICCQAMTADCLACKADLSASAYCNKHPSVDGCAQHLPTPVKHCCQSMDPQCLACQADLTMEEYCNLYPGVEGCKKPEDEVGDC